jgi:hypothetical protein
LALPPPVYLLLNLIYIIIFVYICIFFMQRFEKGYMPDDIAVVDDEPAVVIEEEQLLA